MCYHYCMPHHKQHSNFIVFFIVIIAIVALGGMLVMGLQQRSSPSSFINSPLNYTPTGITTQPQNLISRSNASIDSPASYSVGPKDAKVVFVEFMDYQCPYSQIEVAVVEQLKSIYKDASVRFVMREMPIVKLYPQSINVAEGALCAQDQGKYNEYHNYAFLHQNEINADAPTIFAKNIGLDMATFGLCYTSKLHHQQIVNDLSDAQGLGLTGTPTFYINGEQIVGAAMFSELKNAIDTALKK